MIGRFTGIQNLYESQQFIEPDIYSSINVPDKIILYSKRDFLFKAGSWRGNNVSAGVFSAKLAGSSTLVSGHSDLMTSKKVSILVKYLSGVSQFFGTNTVPFDDFSTSIPLGLTSDEQDSEIHHLFSDHSQLVLASQQTEICDRFEGTIYSNFNVQTNVKKRLPLLQMLPSLPYSVINHEPDVSHRGRVEYLRNLRTSSLVLCPVGNGADTHRIWETLYMGGTPVVLRHPALSMMLADFPVIQLDSWSELSNRLFIEELWSQITEKSWNSQLLTKQYWERLIIQSNQMP